MEARAISEIVVQGIAASPGIAHGRVFLYTPRELDLPLYDIELGQKAGELARLDRALIATRQQIQRIKGAVEHNLGKEEAAIFDAHLLVLEDQALISEIIREMESSSKNIETCFNRVAQRYVKAFAEIDDEYLRERAGDIRDVARRVLQNLLGHVEQALNRLPDKRIVAASDITPSDAAGLDRSHALALVTDSGSKTSHAVIVARTMRVPAVVGLRDLTRRVADGDWVLVDGYEGAVIINPSEQTLYRYGRARETRLSLEQRLLEASGKPSKTLDGLPVALRANIEKAGEMQVVKNHAAQGVGLFRTEFLYLRNNRMPSEEEQFAEYKAAAEFFADAGEPVTIRTLDIGGDKLMTGNPGMFPRESNPFLGTRAIRFCLLHVSLFKEQLRAILRASAHGRVRLMYPMISGPDELDRANEILGECKHELRAKGAPFDEKMPVGAMMEIPSAAAVADILARKCDFFSIGTNDLIQYLLAIDRGNDRIAHLYEPTHPAVVRTIRHIVDQARRYNIKVSVCGEMAGDPVFAALLLGLGVDELSMAAPLIPAVKYLVRAMRMSDAKALAREALKLDSAPAIYDLCNAFSGERLITSAE
jgi:phosphotransferase system enzyme I (PtsI)